MLLYYQYTLGHKKTRTIYKPTTYKTDIIHERYRTVLQESFFTLNQKRDFFKNKN